MPPALVRVEFAPAATRDFRGLSPDVRRRLRPRIDALAVQPRPREAAALRGGENIYRLRVGDYRILYEIREAVLLVLVVRIGHRREIYRRGRQIRGQGGDRDG
jgi:mRNA interferase RelE/StbE